MFDVMRKSIGERAHTLYTWAMEEDAVAAMERFVERTRDILDTMRDGYVYVRSRNGRIVAFYSLSTKEYRYASRDKSLAV